MMEPTTDLPPSSALPDAGLAQRVLNARVADLHERADTGLKVGVVFAAVLVFWLAPTVPAPVLAAWLVLRVFTASLRLYMSRLYKRTHQPDGALWLRRYVRVLAFDGLGWGAMGCWLVLTGSGEQAAMAVMALVGVTAVGAAVMQSSALAGTVFLSTLLLPMAALLLMGSERNGQYTGLGVLLYVGVMILEARRSERRAYELQWLRFSTDRIAQEREEALLLAQRQSAVKGQFLATMSHEMRTPLHGILGLTRQLQQREAATPAPQLAMVEKAGEHLLKLINDALDFSKLEAGHVKLSPQVFDLAALIDDVISLLLPSAYQSGLTLNSRLHMPRPCWVLGDPLRMRQVLHNLVGNAIKFTEAGSVTVVAKHNAKRGRARIAVHDTGVGISAADLPLVFDAFHQADGTFARRFGGTGLGLTIARELARAMGGDLACTSQVGRGSCFTVTVDMPVAPPKGMTAEPLVMNGRNVHALSGRVLLAEDNPVNAIVAEAVLLRLGLTVQMVGDGEQALAAFQARRPDLVLLDCHMPVMDGLQAAHRMREHEVALGWPHTPLIALTANALDGDREQSLAAGMDDHLPKPFRDEALGALLARYLKPALAA